MKKRIVQILAVAVALLIVAAVVVFLSLDSIVKKGVESVGPQLAKVEMRLASASISPLKGRCKLTGFFVGNPEGFKTPGAIQVGEITVALNTGSLLTDTLQVDEVNVQAPEITLEGGLTGNNLSKILDNLDAASAGGEKTESADQPGKKICVKDLVIDGGKVHLSIAGMGGKSMTVPLPPIHLQNLGSQEQGLSSLEFSRTVIKSILTEAGKAAAAASVEFKALEKTGKAAAEEAGKAVKQLKGLFQK